MFASRAVAMLGTRRGARAVPMGLCLAVASMVGCKAYDRGFYASLTMDAGSDVVVSADSAMETGHDVSDTFVPPDAVDAVDTNDVEMLDAAVDVPLVEDTPPPDDTNTVDATDAAIACDAGFGPNLLANPGFETGLSTWDTYVDPLAMATVTVATATPHGGTNYAEGDVTVSGPDEYDVQLMHDSIPLEAGRPIHVEAWIRASSPRTVSGGLERSTSPYTNYCYWSRPVGVEWTLVTFDCTPAVTDPNAMLVFNISTAVGVIDVDDVSFAEFSACP